MNAMELRPLSTGEILDRTFTLYRRYFLLFLGISAIPYILVLAVNMTRAFLVSGATSRSIQATLSLKPQPAVSDPNALFATIGLGLVALVVAILAYLLTQGATVTAVSQIYLGHEITIGESFRRVKGELASLFGVVILSGLASFAGFVLLIFPGFYVMSRLIVCIPAALIEDLGPTDSLERSWGLTKDNAGRAFLIWLLYFVLLIAGSALIAWPFTIGMLLSKNNPGMVLLFLELTQIGTTAVTVLIAPVLTISSSILYFDLRVRKEALDLQMMMKPAGGGVPMATAPTMFS
jgi:membrane-anchored glycerophosphoryl diester phosphodiesterase (GDPDase)